MFESLILGAVQGIAEWLPVSSEAMVVLVKSNFFPTGDSISVYINYAIFLHLGTLFAALVYFRKKVCTLLKQLFSYPSQSKDTKNYLNFIIIGTMTSGLLGFILLNLVEQHKEFFENQTLLNMVVAVFLLITATLLYISEQSSQMKDKKANNKSALVVGLFQALAAIPGISRSGSTLASMALLGYNKVWALEMSFILSIPLVFFANIILNAELLLNLNTEYLIALISSFIFGLLTIEALLKVVKKVRFSYFVAFFACVVLATTFLI